MEQQKINEMKEEPREDLAGDQVDIKDYAGRELVVEKIILLASTFKEGGKFALVQFSCDGKQHNSAIGAKQVVSSLEHNKDNMPFRCVLKKEKSEKSGRIYYVLEPTQKAAASAAPSSKKEEVMAFL